MRVYCGRRVFMIKCKNKYKKFKIEITSISNLSYGTSMNFAPKYFSIEVQ